MEIRDCFSSYSLVNENIAPSAAAAATSWPIFGHMQMNSTENQQMLHMADPMTSANVQI
jgi:hypothetical protein